MSDQVLVSDVGRVRVVTLNRPWARNAVDSATAALLTAAFRAFDAEDAVDVAVLTGEGGTFCAGADLKSIASGPPNRVGEDVDAPMGPTRLLLGKPVIAAVEGHAVAGGLELALWCDLRVAAADALFGVTCRRFGVPLIDLGTVRLPRLIGQSHALDLILTGRLVDGPEAYRMGLVNRLAPPGQALAAAVVLANELAALPQVCMRNDRLSVYEQWSLGWEKAAANELRRGIASLASEQAAEGARRFATGAGRHGASLHPS
ncbi:MAG: crotonase/enoyl-CoA hydratase family protein [Frankiaceae bacterium]